MRTAALATAAIALLGLLGVVSAAAPPAAAPAATASRTLVFDVRFSPFAALHLNPAPDPTTGFGLGDELTFHDLLLSHGKQVGDDGGACVIVDAGQLLASCTEVIRLPEGTITTQFLNSPPPEKHLAVTGGTGLFRSAGGDATLIEFGDGTGRLTLHLLALSR